jgi:hypothetical protein
VFMKLYEKDLDSDVESVDEAPSPRKVVQSPVKLSERERKESIRRVAEMNKVSLDLSYSAETDGQARDEDDIEIDLDQELGLDEPVDLDTDTSDVETFQETAYSVSRVSRHSKIIEQVSVFLSNGIKLTGSEYKIHPINGELPEFCPGRITHCSSSWDYWWR